MSRKGENIFKRKDGRWEARYVHHYECGQARYQYIYGSTYAEVKAKKMELQLSEEPVDLSAAKQSASFYELATLWLADIRFAVKESTYTRYYRIVDKYLCPYLHSQILARMDQGFLQRFPEKLLTRGGANGKPLSAKTVSDILCVLKSILKYGKENGYPCPNAGCLHYPPKTPRPVRIVEDEYRAHLEQALLHTKNTTSLGILFTLFTGVRIGELCGLRWEDINFAAATANIHRTVERIADLDPNTETRTKIVIGEPKTGSSMRVIPLPAFLLQYLREQQCGPKCYLLTGTRRHTEPHQYYMRYRRFLEKNGLDSYTFHALRHTFATRCVEAGFDSKSLAEILGHAGISTTLSVYVHPTLQQKKTQMERLTPDGCL